MSIYFDDIETPSQRLLRVAVPEESDERWGIMALPDPRPKVYAVLAKPEVLPAEQSLGTLIGCSGPEALGLPPSPSAYAVLIGAEDGSINLLRALAKVCAKRLNITPSGQGIGAPVGGTLGDEGLALEASTVLVCKGPTPSSPPVFINWSYDAGFDFHAWTMARLGEMVVSSESEFEDDQGAAFFAAADAAVRSHRAAFDAGVEYDREARDYARDE